MTPEFTFDPEFHIYRLDGARLPSVTQAMASGGLIEFSGMSPEMLKAYAKKFPLLKPICESFEAAAEFGSAVHRACELDDLGTLDEDFLAPAIAPYLEAWRKFKREYGALHHAIEEPMYSPKYQFAGTPDRLDLIDLKDAKPPLVITGGGKCLTVIEIKTCALAPKSAAIQTAAAAFTKGEWCDGAKLARATVLLKPDATYRFNEHTDKTDFNVFLAALTIWRRKERDGANAN